MNLLQSICCLFKGGCAEEEPGATKARPVAADLGQEEAELEKAGKERMSHMKTGGGAKDQRRNSSDGGGP